MGTAAECAALVDELRGAPGVRVVDVSQAYPNRRRSVSGTHSTEGGGLVRVYLEVRLSGGEASR